MDRAQTDLQRHLPRLVQLWRRARHGGAGRGGSPQRGSAGGGGAPRRGGALGRAADSRGGRPPADRLAPDELRDVARGVQQLSLGLTRDRALAGARYMDDARLLGAYLLFYWPLSYLQARGILSELATPPRAVLDLGSGPGPMAFAALDAGAADVLAADRSRTALDAARALAQAAGEPLRTAAWDPHKPASLASLANGRRFDAVVLGHVVNEIFGGDVARRAALVAEAAALLAPGGSVVVIEPALRETSRALLAVRDALVEGGLAIRAPCLFRGPCPARLRDSDWCHAERPIDPPPLVADVARAAGLRKEAVKMSYLVVAPPGEAWEDVPPPRHAGAKLLRIVSEPLPSKGRLRYMACGAEGRLGLALQEKHVTPANARFEGLLRGDVVELTNVEPRGDGLRLGPDSTVEVVAPAGTRVRRG